MSDLSYRRAAAKRTLVGELRLAPGPVMPDRLKRSFPELIEWDNQRGDTEARNADSIRQALGSITDTGDDFVAAFEGAL